MSSVMLVRTSSSISWVITELPLAISSFPPAIWTQDQVLHELKKVLPCEFLTGASVSSFSFVYESLLEFDFVILSNWGDVDEFLTMWVDDLPSLLLAEVCWWVEFEENLMDIWPEYDHGFVIWESWKVIDPFFLPSNLFYCKYKIINFFGILASKLLEKNPILIVYGTFFLIFISSTEILSFSII